MGSEQDTKSVDDLIFYSKDVRDSLKIVEKNLKYSSAKILDSLSSQKTLLITRLNKIEKELEKYADKGSKQAMLELRNIRDRENVLER